MRRKKRWRAAPGQPHLVRELSRRHAVPELVAQILINRGLSQEQDIISFLDPALSRLLPPAGLQDLAAAARRLARAVTQQETVAVYGDYDVDGLTATTLLRHFLESLGVRVVSYIPNRLTQGYGLHSSALTELAGRATLLVTVDCGISNAPEVAAARELGLEIIVTDHHEPPPELPPALAVINPKRGDCGYAFKDLAGVGVALNLALGLRACLREQGWFAHRREPNIKDYLDLVALGTAADVVPLTGVNRILVSQGLEVLTASRRPGIQALKEVACLAEGPVTLRDVAFKLAPRLNAAGRLGQTRAALELLLTEDRRQAQELARHLDRLNRERQAAQNTILATAEAQIQQQRLHHRAALILAAGDWHAGIIGIVAAKLAERYNRPVALLTEENGLGRGSARSVPAFDLFAGLTACREHLLKFGGHPAAAGFTIDLNRLESFREAFETVVAASLGHDPGPSDISLDAEVSLSQLDDAFFFHLNRLRPFGAGNPAPNLACLAAQVVESRIVGQNHLKLKLGQKGKIFSAIAFNQGALNPLQGSYDIAFTPQLNFYQGRLQPELVVLDLCAAGV